MYAFGFQIGTLVTLGIRLRLFLEKEAGLPPTKSKYIPHCFRPPMIEMGSVKSQARETKM